MGRNLFFAQQNVCATKTRHEQHETNGYVFGAHRYENSIRNKDKKTPRTKSMHYGAMNLWMKFVAIYGIEGYRMGPGCATPDHTLIKEFLRWYSHTARGKKSKNGRPVMTSVLNCAERLFGGFEMKLQITIKSEDRSEVFNWIKRTLSEAEGVVENVEEPDYSFTKKDFLRLISSMWQTDHRRFMPGLLKAIIMLALQLYLFTGARIGAFIPPHQDRSKKGLRYEDIVLVLFPSDTAPWKVEWKVNQKWLKGNRNPDYAVFGIGIRDTRRPQFASGYLLLAIALQHGALFGIDTVEDLAKYDLSSGKPIELRWKDDFLKKPVLRNVTADGPQDNPLHKERFCELLRELVVTAGYSKSVTVHVIRKYLGSVIEGRHGSALVSQIYGHKDAGTYPKEYLLHCSSIDTVSAVLGEEEQSQHIEYFQSFERFYEQGYPTKLPAEIEASILQNPELTANRQIIERLQALNNDRDALLTEKLIYKKALLRLRIASLKEYQNNWVRSKRDQRIINRGKENPIVCDNDVSTRAQFLIMPELAKISALMSSNRELAFDEMLAFVDDLKTLSERDFDVAYLPQESPVQGRCPAKDCTKEIRCLKKTERSTHIHHCVKRGIALDLQIAEAQLKYCYECMTWQQTSQWRSHCSLHIRSWKTQHCEVIVYRNTVIRPGYCPFCLWDESLWEEDRFHQWLKSGNLKQHIESKHILGDQWPSGMPVCGCGRSFVDERGLRNHLHDTHKLNKAIWLNVESSKKRKSDSKLEDQVGPAKQDGKNSKRIRFSRYPPPREMEKRYNLSTSFFFAPKLEAFIEEKPENIEYPNIDCNGVKASESTSIQPHLPIEIPSLHPPLTTALTYELIDPRLLECLDDAGPEKAQSHDLDHAEETLHASVEEREEVPISPAVCSVSLRPPTDDILRSNAHFVWIPPSANGSTRDEMMRDSSCNETTHSHGSSAGKAIAVTTETLISQESCGASTSNTQDLSIDIQGAREYTSEQKPSGQVIEQISNPDARSAHEQKRKRCCSSARPSDLIDVIPPKKLSIKDKQRLRTLKQQKFTLRQAGAYFPNVERSSLRQAWMGIDASWGKRLRSLNKGGKV